MVHCDYRNLLKLNHLHWTCALSIVNTGLSTKKEKLVGRYIGFATFLSTFLPFFWQEGDYTKHSMSGRIKVRKNKAVKAALFQLNSMWRSQD